MESEHLPSPEHAEAAAPRDLARASAAASPILGQVGNQAVGRLLASPSGARALQRLAGPRRLARWDWPWKAPPMAADPPETIDRDMQLDPNMFLRNLDTLSTSNPAPQPWVQGQWSTPDFTGEQTASVTEITKRQLYDEIGRVAPGLTRAFKVCLVGHAWVEQQGKNILNFNFGGVEGGSSAYVMGWTSAAIPTATYENDPDRETKYRDWDSKGHNPKFGKWKGHEAGTIAVQLAMVPKPAEIVVLVRKRRPAYQSLSHAAAAFVNLIQRRIDALRASTQPDHNQLAEQAFGGDADAYANIVNHRFAITGTDGKKHDFGAYNGDPGYYGLVKASITAADAEMPQ